MLFVHNDVVRRILTIKETIPVLERAFQQTETGESLEVERTASFRPCMLRTCQSAVGRASYG